MTLRNMPRNPFYQALVTFAKSSDSSRLLTHYHRAEFRLSHVAAQLTSSGG